MKINKLLIGIIVLLVAVNITVLSFVFFSGNKHRSDAREHRVDSFMHRKLDLSPKQIEAFDSLRALHLEYTKTLSKAIHKDRKDLLRLMETPEDSAAIDKKLQSISDKNAQLEKANFEHWTQLRKLCTPAQVQKFDTLVVRMIDRQGYARKHKKIRKEK